MNIYLTHPDGSKLEINADQISERFENDGTMVTRKAKSVVVMENGHVHGVMQTLSEIDQLIKEQKE